MKIRLLSKADFAWLPTANCAKHILRGTLNRATPLILNLSLVPRSKLASLPCGLNDRISQAKTSNVAVSARSARLPVALRNRWVKLNKKSQQKTTPIGVVICWLPLLDLNQRPPDLVSVTTKSMNLLILSPMSWGTHIFFTRIL